MADKKDWLAVAVLLGPPASGKGTFAASLSNMFGFPIIYPGGIYKEFRKGDGELNRLCNDLLTQGKYCPSWLTNKIMKDETERLYAEGAKAVILDGYPRDQEQLDFLHETWTVGTYMHIESEYSVMESASASRRNCAKCKFVFSAKNPPGDEEYAENAAACIEGASWFDPQTSWFDPQKGLMIPGCAVYDPTSWERRPDDTPELYVKRYATHMALTQPIINAIKDAPNYIRADILGGVDTFETILDQIMKLPVGKLIAPQLCE